MQQAITGFHRDDDLHWVAELACGHFRHVRHDPPWQDRPWVVTPGGRDSQRGSLLACRKCDDDAPADARRQGGLLLRRLTRADLPAVMTVQAACYPPAMVEAAATLQRRLAAAGDHVWVAAADDAVHAYLFAYPSRLGKVTALGADFAVPAGADCLYLHDLAVAPAAAGLGLGPALVRHAWAAAVAAGLRHSALVSVQGSRAFWTRLGYREHAPLAADAGDALATYAGAACYLTRPLPAPEPADATR